MNWERIIINWIFRPNPSFPSFDYFFVAGPLGDPKLVPKEVFGPTDSIENISINIWKKSISNVDRNVFNGISRSENLLWDKFWISQGTKDKEIAKIVNFISVTSCKFSIILMLITRFIPANPLIGWSVFFFIRINKDFSK